MIIGYSCDVKHDGLVYHAQTKDLGPIEAAIVSSISVNGQIVASLRLDYYDLITQPLDTTLLAKQLKYQHTLICTAVKSGRIHDISRLNSNSNEC